MTETSDPIPPSSPLPLEYGKNPRRNITLRRLVLLVALVLAMAAGWKWGPSAYTRCAVYYYQWRCLNYSPPRDLVVFEADPEASKILLQQPGYVEAEMWVTGGSSGIPPEKRPLIAEYQLAFFDDFLSIASITLVRPPMRSEPSVRAICFMGELKSPSGQRRLVVVDCVPWGPRQTPSGLESGFMRAYTTIPGTLWQGPTSFNPMPSRPILPGPNFKVFAGQRDPADPSHFTIPYQFGNQQSIMDGRLHDGGNVSLTRRQPVSPNHRSKIGN